MGISEKIALIGLIIALCSFAGTVFVAFVGRIIAVKVTENNVGHLSLTVNEIKTNLGDFLTLHKTDTEKINRRLMKIEKGLFTQQVICEERHGRNPKIKV